MLPFLKNRDDGVGAGPVETKERAHDEGFDMLDAVAEDMMKAFKSGDVGMLKSALQAFCDYDDVKDQETLGA